MTQVDLIFFTVTAVTAVILMAILFYDVRKPSRDYTNGGIIALIFMACIPVINVLVLVGVTLWFPLYHIGESEAFAALDSWLDRPSNINQNFNKEK